MKNIIILFLLSLLVLTGCVSVTGDTPVVYDKPIVKSFMAKPATVNAGGSSTLNWTVAGATNVYIDQGVGNVALTGSTAVAPQSNTTYTLTAANSFGTTTARTQVTVSGSTASPTVPPAAGDKPTINYFTASPDVISKGSSVTLTWSIFGATNIQIVPEIGPPEAEVAVTIFPAATTSYKLTAANSAGSISREVKVTVMPESVLMAGEKYVELGLLANESGSLVKSGTTYFRSTSVCVGDNPANFPSRAFLSFDLSSIPINAIIKEAVLDFGPYTISGSPKYGGSVHGNMGALEFYRVRYSKYDDLGRLTYEPQVGQVGTARWDGDSGVPIKVDVTRDDNGANIIESLLAESGTRCQFRVQFFTTTNWDSVPDLICLDKAVLKVKYTLP